MNLPRRVCSSLQELWPYSRVRAHSLRNLADVGAGALADGGHRVDAGDPLGEKGVGGQLGELRRPRAHGQNLFPVDPVPVDRGEGLHGPGAVLAHLAADEDPVRVEQVVDGAPLGEELRVGEHLVGHSRPLLRLEDRGDALRGLHGDGRLLHDNLEAGLHRLADVAGGQLDKLEVGRLVLAVAIGLGGGVDTDEYDVRLTDRSCDVCTAWSDRIRTGSKISNSLSF